MDYMTIIGFVGALSVLFLGIVKDGSVSALINLHGVTIVVGGTFFATMVNSSLEDIWNSARAALYLLAKPKFLQPQAAISEITRLATRARQEGLRSLQDEGRTVGDDGFVSRAIDVCMTVGDERLARLALEKEIGQMVNRHKEVGNIYRTAGLLAPMFGLLGTLIGIIQVLRNISEVESVGPAMATAISSAFYGILLANLLFVPGAGKLRNRSLSEYTSKEIILEGLMDIFFSDRIPVLIETRLLSYLQSGKIQAQGDRSGPPMAGIK